MEFRILGSVEVWEDGRPLELGAGRQRALLALLLLHADEVVSADRLIDALWGESPPASAAKVVQGYVSQLRRALPPETILTRGSGYLIPAGATDADEFERLLDAARRQPPREAAATLRSALALWRGPPLVDVAYEAWAQAEIARLEELRLVALEERIDADLSLGAAPRLVPELEALVAEHPLRERLRGQLMLALYRSGRQAEALECYREARQALSEELGLDPGPALQELERRILQQDPGLEPPLLAGRLAVVPPSLLRRGRALVLVGVVLVGAAVATAAFELTRSSGRSQGSRDAVAAIDSRSGRPLAHIPVGDTPTSVALGEGSVWVLNADDATVSRIDPATSTVVKVFATGGTPTDIAAGGGALWVGNASAQTGSQLINSVVMSSVSRLDPSTGVVTHTAELTGSAPVTGPSGPNWTPGVSQLAVGAGAVWAVDPNERLARIDLASGQRIATVSGLNAVAVAAGPEGVWVDDGVRTVERIDTQTNSVAARIPITASGLSGIAVGAGAVWVADSIDGTLWRIDPGPPAVTRTIPVGVGATGVSFGDGAVWVVNWLRGSVLRIDPSSNSITRRIELAGTPQAVAVGSGRAWVSVDAGFGTPAGAPSSPLVSRVEPLPSSLCGSIAYGGSSRLQYLIASDLPLQGPTRASTLPMTEAILFVLRQHHFRAGRYTIGYQSCDDSTAQAGMTDQAKCGVNTQAYAHDKQLLGLIGPYTSDCARIEIPIANKAGLAMVGLNTNPSLTHGGPGTRPGEPGVFYPTGQRNYVRLYPPDDVQGAAYALFAGSLGLRRVYLLTDAGDIDYGPALMAGFRRAARAAHVTIAGVGEWDPAAKSYLDLAERISRSRAAGVMLGGYSSFGIRTLIAQLRSSVGPSVTILSTDGFMTIPGLRKLAGQEAQGLYLSYAGEPNQSLPAAGQRFMKKFAATQPGGVVLSYGAVYAAEATEVLLEAIAHSDGTRASVTRALLRTRDENGLFGSFHFNKNGDIVPAPITIFRVTGAERRSSTLIEDFNGSRVVRVVHVPANLVAASSQP